MSDTCGPTSLTPFAFYDPDSSCWRTSQGTFPLDSTPCSVTLPTSGSMRSGALYERATWAPATAELGCSSLPTPRATRGGSATETVALLPTPIANLYEQEDVDAYLARRERLAAEHRNGNGFGLVLSMAVRLLPTPTTEPTTGNGHARNLGAEVRLLPTPTARDWKDGAPCEAVEENALLGRVVWDFLPTPRSTRGGSATETVRLLPTPTSMDSRSSGGNPQTTGTHGTTLTDVTARGHRPLTGAPTPPPSPDTPPRSDDPHPTLWTDEGG